MKEKTRVSPTVTQISKDIIQKHGLKDGQAYEEYALLLATKNPMLVAKRQVLQEKLKEQLKDRQTLDNRIRKTQAELERIDELEKNDISVEDNGFDSALRLITKRLSKYAQADADGKWDLKKMKLKEVVEICNTHTVPYESVLQRVHPNLLRYVEGYTTLCV